MPMPDQSAREHSARVLAVLHDEIDRVGGILDFSRYMELVLYAPGLGYYSAGKNKFGQAGDFITAPEISALFSQCMARQSAEVLDAVSGGSILEFGAGSGRMAADILGELASLDSLPDEYLILDLSADLRQRQRSWLENTIPEWMDRVRWIDSLPVNFRGVMLANEVLDAMPVHRIEFNPGKVREWGVAMDGEQLVWRLCETVDKAVQGRVFDEANRIMAQIQDAGFGEGYVSEINLAARDWIAALAGSLERGAVLLADYGFPRHEYYHADRREGTLMCHYHHHAHDDPLVLPGLQDITAHVDFTSVAEAAVENGLSVAGYTGQAAFLLGAGLTEIMQATELDELARLEQAQQVKKLTLPHEMGELFKVMALTREVDIPLSGFSFQDNRGRL